jgi:hypothetical protein
VEAAVNDITELVDLPDPAVQPLVHPLDLPAARRLYRRSWWTGALSGWPVGVLVAALVWFASGSYLIAVLVGALVLVLGPLAARMPATEAWGHIPRRRQDRARPAPLAWEVGAAAVGALLLAAAIVLTALRLDRPAVPVGVRQVVLGMGAAVVLLAVLDAAGGLRRAAGGRRALLKLPGIVATAVGLTIGYGVLFGASGAGLAGQSAWGAGGMLAAGAVTAGWRLAVGRRGRTVDR